MLHLSSWTATLPILVIGMVGILLVMGVLVLAVMLLNKLTHRKRSRRGASWSRQSLRFRRCWRSSEPGRNFLH